MMINVLMCFLNKKTMSKYIKPGGKLETALETLKELRLQCRDGLSGFLDFIDRLPEHRERRRTEDREALIDLGLRVRNALAKTVVESSKPVAGLAAGLLIEGAVKELRGWNEDDVPSPEPSTERDPRTSIPEENSNYVKAFDDRVNSTMMRSSVRNNHRVIVSQISNRPSSKNSKLSRLEYARGAFQGSDVLPVHLKNILPYVPFQESNYRTSAQSRVLNNRTGERAKGAWQFRIGTGKKYGLFDGGKDRRSDFERSTRAAVAYFEKIYNDLSKNKNYQSLKKKYNLSNDDPFLAYMTINGFNSGEGHMIRAVRVMDTEASIKKDVDKHAQGGGRTAGYGLFVYLTQVYIHDYKKWQPSRPYYYKESSDYVYRIEAYRRIDQGVERITESEQPTPSPGDTDEDIESEDSSASMHNRTSSNGWAFTRGFVVAAAAYLGVKRKGMTRREFLAAPGVGVVGGAGSLVEKYVGPVEGVVDNIKIPEGMKGLKRIKDAKAAAKYIDKIQSAHDRAVSNIDDFDKYRVGNMENEGVHNGRYGYNQHMADSCFELYNETSDREYIRLAQYFYQRAYDLALAQKEGRIRRLPKGGMTKVNERLAYCARALNMVNADFRKPALIIAPNM